MSAPHPTSGTNFVWTNKASKAQWSKELLAWDKEDGERVFHSARTTTAIHEYWSRWLQKYKKKRAYLNGTGSGTIDSPVCYNYDQIDMLAGQRMGINPGEILDGDPSMKMMEEALEDTEKLQDDQRRPRLTSISSDIDENIDLSLLIRNASLSPEKQSSSHTERKNSSQTIGSQETPKGLARDRRPKCGYDSYISQTIQESMAARTQMSEQREEKRWRQFEAELEIQRERLAFEKQEADDRRERERREAEERRREAEERREERLFQQNLILHMLKQKDSIKE